MLTAQHAGPKRIDSLKNVLEHTNNNDTGKIVKIAEELIANTDSDEEKFYLLGVIISSYATKNDRKKSIEYLFRAKQIAENLNDVGLTIRVYATIASLYASLKVNDKAMLYLKQAWQQTEKLPAGDEKSSMQAFLYNEQGNFYYNTEDYRQANKNFSLSLGKFKETLDGPAGANTPFYYKSLLHNYGKSFLHLSQPDSSMLYLNRALVIKDTLYPNLKYHIYLSLSEAYAAKAQYRRATDTLEALLKDKAFAIPELQLAAYLNLSRNYKALGDTEKYTFYNEKYLALMPHVKQEDVEAISTVYAAEQQELLNKAKTSQSLLMWGIAGVVVAGAVVAYFTYRKRKREKAIYTGVIQNLERRLASNTAVPQAAHTVTDIPQATVPVPVEQDILHKLAQFEAANRFTSPKITLATLAVQFKTNTNYLSEVINREKGKNFNAYLNELRINYICNLIHTNPEYLNYKISYLAESCGFASHSSFATVFKNVTGISPSAFLKQAAKDFSNK
ncbi:hypothetical protein AM493_16350 [Flavobacterium akiainvivens]|uniref:HTH araC/xylS-type domain-containing protein n=1 Tax=Flavobacterium akiainvivens TaxID=1202724 RepID=A0A0M9VJ79_9FLAO|nr:hypothetical protein AM493_16350 [Flavobacterium akiainvivens]SFQ48166.1 Helix-turn-helix domain-containing protein [Flavobacterium akiainvivens]